MLYYIIAASVPEGASEGRNVLRTATTRAGQRVCAKQAVEEFPDLFLGRRLTLVDLTPEDFPAPAPPSPW